MLILLSNDDGVEAPGLAALVEALASPDNEIVVVAPRVEQSAKSHSLTLYEPLRVDDWTPRHAGSAARWYAAGGTPADCAYLGIHKLCGRRPDVVLSGINYGSNLGDDVHYSGTVAAAMEAALQGIPALAVSLGTGDRDKGDPIWETAGAVARRVVTAMMADPLPPNTFLNLNVPGVPLDRLAGVVVCPMGKRYYHPMVKINQDPRGRAYYWIGGGHDRFEGWDRELAEEEAPPEDQPLDGWSFERGYATLTPLHPDMTARGSLERVARWNLLG